jgi:Flp pilus assembly protein TadB
MRRRHDDPVRITSAQRPRSEDISGRQRRYLISMGIRTVCFILAVVSIGHWFMWVFLVAALFLPYIAVVMANAGSSADPDAIGHEHDPDRRALRDRPDTQ